MKTDRQQRALKIIYDYWKKNGAYPSNAEMVRLLTDVKDANQWGNTRRAMFKNGKLEESESGTWDFKLSDKILADFIENDTRIAKVSAAIEAPKNVDKLPAESPTRTPVKPTSQVKLSYDAQQIGDIPIYGQVVAGTDRGPDDLIVDLSPSGDTLPILDVDDGRSVFALEVQGRSMVSDSILPNDYVIVERVSLIEIKDGDLIVAKYLKEKFNDINDPEIVEAAFENPNNYDGPTLKYFRQLQVKTTLADGQEFEEVKYQLAPKNKDHRYTVITRHLEPDDLGRVISIHRMIRKLN